MDTFVIWFNDGEIVVVNNVNSFSDAIKTYEEEIGSFSGRNFTVGTARHIISYERIR